MADPKLPDSGHDNPGEWWTQQSLPPSGGKPADSAPATRSGSSSPVPPSPRPTQGRWPVVVAATLIVLLGGVLLLVFLPKKESEPSQPDPEVAQADPQPIGDKNDLHVEKPGPDSKDEDRILGYDLHPDPPAVGQALPVKLQPEEGPFPDLKPPEEKAPSVDLPRPTEEPKKPPIDLTKPTEEPKKPPTETEKPPVTKPTVTKPNRDALVEKRLARSESALRRELAKVPELRLVTDLELKTFREGQKVAALASRGTGNGYAFNARLTMTMYQRALKEGLPVHSGPSAQLNMATALTVQTVSKELRRLGFVSVPGLPSRFSGPSGGFSLIPGASRADGSPQGKTQAFKKWCDANSVEKYTGALATLLQMLQVEDESTRLVLVREMAKSKAQAAGVVLATRALTDPSEKVRKAAIAALKPRPIDQYQRVLLQGFSYPWPPLGDHAAQALVALEAKESVPEMVKLLDQPDPALPVIDPKTHKRTVREMVRLNHMRNCLLCHPPSAATTDLVRGAAPTPGQPLPPAYYESQTGDFVRADTTFLRQSFSITMTVADAAPWPAEQRFDFLVRKRVLPDKETDTEAKPQDGGFPQREALTYALRKLTGEDGGDSKQKWEQLVGLAAYKGKKGAKDPRTKEVIAQLDEKAVPFLRFAKKLIDEGMVDKAKQRLEEIVKEFWGTPSADEAKRLLKGLENKK